LTQPFISPNKFLTALRDDSNVGSNPELKSCVTESKNNNEDRTIIRILIFLCLVCIPAFSELSAHAVSRKSFTITAVAFSPNGKLIASAGEGQGIHVWDVSSAEQVRRFGDHSGTVAFSPDGKILASGNNLWDVATGKELHELSGHKFAVESVAFSPDRKWLATASDDSIRLWEAGSGKPVRTISKDYDPASNVAFSTDSKTLARGSCNAKLIKLWDVASGRKLPPLEGH